MGQYNLIRNVISMVSMIVAMTLGYSHWDTNIHQSCQMFLCRIGFDRFFLILSKKWPLKRQTCFCYCYWLLFLMLTKLIFRNRQLPFLTDLTVTSKDERLYIHHYLVHLVEVYLVYFFYSICLILFGGCNTNSSLSKPLLLGHMRCRTPHHAIPSG